MLSETTVFWMLVGFWVAVVIVEVFLSVNKEERESWSEFVRACAQKSTFFPWGWSVLAGHFFHPGFEHMKWGWLILAIVSVVVIGIGLLVFFLHRKYNKGFLLRTWIPLIPGWFAGALLWPVGV